jgi:hypothetical protein
MVMPAVPRRSIAKGAAWSVPAVALASSAPAYASSQVLCTPGECPTVTFLPGTWTLSKLGEIKDNTGSTDVVSSWEPEQGTNGCLCNEAPSGQPPLACAAGGPGGGGPYTNVAIAEQDPDADGAGLVLAQGGKCLAAGTVLNFTFDWASYGANPIGTNFRVFIEPTTSANSGSTYTNVTSATTGTQLGTTVSAPGAVKPVDGEYQNSSHNYNQSGSTGGTYTVPTTGEYTIKLV